MKKTPNPRTRRKGLIIRELPDELLVYDEKSHRAHCLNASAASVFQSADGSLTVAQIASAASARLGAPLSEDLTWLALEELDKNNLLETALPLVPQGPTRRDVISVGAAAAVMLPIVLAITAPTPAQTQSGISGITGSTVPMMSGSAPSSGPF